MNAEQYRVAFKHYDKDNSGYLSTTEFKEMMESIGEDMTKEELKEFIILADNDKDGKISFEEYVALLNLVD